MIAVRTLIARQTGRCYLGSLRMSAERCKLVQVGTRQYRDLSTGYDAAPRSGRHEQMGRGAHRLGYIHVFGGGGEPESCPAERDGEDFVETLNLDAAVSFRAWWAVVGGTLMRVRMLMGGNLTDSGLHNILLGAPHHVGCIPEGVCIRGRHGGTGGMQRTGATGCS